MMSDTQESQQPTMDTSLSRQPTMETSLSRQLTHDELLEHRDCPRNWPNWWRFIILFNISFYNLLGNVFANGFSSVQADIAADLKITLVAAGRLGTWGLLTMGLANIWGVAASRKFGRRYTILFSLLPFLACNIWFGKATTYGSAVGSRVVGGLFGGIVESIGPAMIEEVFAPHELARALVVYTCSLAAGSSLGPVLSGYVAAGTGDWRWFCWVLAFCCAFLVVTCTLMLPETSFPITEDQLAMIMGDTVDNRTDIVSQTEEKDAVATHTDTINTPTSSPTDSWFQVWWKNSFFLHHPYVHRPHSWIRFLIDPALLIGVPAILLTTIIFGMTIGWSIVSGINYAQHFATPPLLWKSSSIGLLALAPLIGLIIGSVTGGPLADWYMSRPIAGSNPGDHERGAFGGAGHKLERRLIVAALPSLIYPAGLLIIGFSLKNYEPWIATAVGLGILGWGITAACNPFITYCIDCYPAYAGRLAVTINVFKNCLAYGLAFGTVAWIDSVGQIETYGTMTGLLYAMLLLMIPIYFWGKPIRIWTYTWLK